MLRNFGFSKDNKVNQVQVVMGLLIDQDGIPIDYELFPGNTNEFGTMLPLSKRLQSEYGIERVVVTADRGLNRGANLLALRKIGLEYVIAYRLISVDRDRILAAEAFDGYYGICYSDPKMTPDEVLSIHHSLWQIEESFRLSKSLLEARPCFHWTEARIRGHLSAIWPW